MFIRFRFCVDIKHPTYLRILARILEARDEVDPSDQLEHVTVADVPAAVETNDEIEQVSHQEEDVDDDDDDDDAPNVQIEELGPGKRTTSLPVRLKDYVLQVVCDTDMDTGDCGEGIDFPISKYIDCSKFSPKYRTFLAAVIAGTEPTTFRDAVASKEWQEAMQKEIEALEKNKHGQ